MRCSVLDLSRSAAGAGLALERAALLRIYEILEQAEPEYLWAGTAKQTLLPAGARQHRHLDWYIGELAAPTYSAAWLQSSVKSDSVWFAIIDCAVTYDSLGDVIR